MKYWQAFILYLAAFTLQPFLNHLIPLVGNNINLILCLTIVLTFLYDDNLQGILFGLIFGMFYDLCFGMYLGPGTFSLVAVGIVVYLLKGFTNIENILNVVFMTLISTWMYASTYWVVYSFIDYSYSYLYAMKSLPWQLLFNCIVVVAIYAILVKKIVRHRRDRYFR